MVRFFPLSFRFGCQVENDCRASLHTFHPRSEDEVDIEGFKIADSSLASYLGIEKRDGLVSIGKRLLESMYFFH